MTECLVWLASLSTTKVLLTWSELWLVVPFQRLETPWPVPQSVSLFSTINWVGRNVPLPLKKLHTSKIKPLLWSVFRTPKHQEWIARNTLHGDDGTKCRIEDMALLLSAVFPSHHQFPHRMATAPLSTDCSNAHMDTLVAFLIIIAKGNQLSQTIQIKMLHALWLNLLRLEEGGVRCEPR